MKADRQIYVSAHAPGITAGQQDRQVGRKASQKAGESQGEAGTLARRLSLPPMWMQVTCQRLRLPVTSQLHTHLAQDSEKLEEQIWS